MGAARRGALLPRGQAPVLAEGLLGPLLLGRTVSLAAALWALLRLGGRASVWAEVVRALLDVVSWALLLRD